MIALATALLAAAPAVLRFAPEAGARYRLTIATERDDDGVSRRFTATREVVFVRDGAGWLLTITRTGASAAPDSGGAMFARAEQALAGTSVRYRLDAAGRLRGIDDEAGALERIAAAIDGMGGRARAAAAKRMGDGLRALSPAERHAFLAEDARMLLAPAVAPGRRRATLPGQSGAAALDGTIEATLAAGRLTVHGRFADAATERDELRVFDAARGLLLSARERTVRRVAGATSIAVTSSVLAAPAS